MSKASGLGQLGAVVLASAVTAGSLAPAPATLPGADGTTPLAQVAAAPQNAPASAANWAQCEPKWSAALEALELQQPASSLDAVLVLVPDPVEAGALLAFDRVVEAVVSAAAELRYARQSHWFPWNLDERERASSTCHRYAPGLIRFRPLDTQNAPLLVLLVGESSISGASKPALARAQELAGHFYYRGTVGPYHSGSSRAFLQDLARTPAQVQRAYGKRLASGTVQASSLREKLRAHAVEVFTNSTKERQAQVRSLLYNGRPGRLHLLNEDGTDYGGHRLDEGLLKYPVPPSLSALRVAARSEEERAQKSHPRAVVRMPLERTSTPLDMIPKAASYGAAAVTDLAIRSIVDDLDRRRAAEVAIQLTATEDVVFLASRVHAYSPDKRIVLLSHDRLLLHPEYALDLDGALVVTAYPSLGEPERRYTLARESAVGIYWAMHWLLGDERQRDKAKLASNPAIGVIHRGQLWALAARDPERLIRGSRAQASGSGRAPPELYLVLLAWLSMSLLSLDLVLAARWKRWRRWWSSQRAPRHDGLAFLHAHAVLVCHLSIFGLGSILLAALWPTSGRRVFAAWLAYPLIVSLIWVGLACAQALSQVIEHHRALRSVVATQPGKATRQQGMRMLALGLLLLFITAVGTLGVRLATLGQLLPSGKGSQGAPLQVDGALYVWRALHLADGVSPLLPICAAFLVALALHYVSLSRLRLLDARAHDYQEGRPSLAAATGLRVVNREFEALEEGLWRAAWFAGEEIYWLGLLAALVVPPLLVVIFQAEAMNPWERHFALENGWQNIAIGMSLLTAYGLIVVRACNLARLWLQTSRALAAITATPLFQELGNLRAPFVRSVAVMLSSGRTDPSELRCVRDLFVEVGAMAITAAHTETHTETITTTVTTSLAPASTLAAAQCHSLTWSEEFGSICKAAETSRSCAPLADPKRATPELALAHLLAFVIARWVRQFRLLMAPLVVASLILLGTAATYPFVPHRLLSSCAMLLVTLVVVIGAYVLIGMERNPVLARIGRTPVDSLRLQDHFVRILAWGVLPMSAVFSTYSPETLMLVRRWLTELGP